MIQKFSKDPKIRLISIELRSPNDTTTKLVYTNRTFEIIIGEDRFEDNIEALRTLLFWHS